MSTANTPDWQAMAQPIAHTPDADTRTLAAIRLAHAALARSSMFMVKRFELIDADGNPQDGTDPQARKMAGEMSAAYRELSELIFRLTGREI